jgi:hypothetical protein
LKVFAGQGHAVDYEHLIFLTSLLYLVVFLNFIDKNKQKAIKFFFFPSPLNVFQKRTFLYNIYSFMDDKALLSARILSEDGFAHLPLPLEIKDTNSRRNIKV